MTGAMQKRLIPSVVAVCTYFMGRLAILHTRLQPSNQDSGVKLHQLVPLFLSFPVFELHQLLFKFTYALNQQRLVLLGFHEFAGELNDKRVAVSLT